MTYDAANQLQTSVDSGGATTYTYDSAGNLTKIQGPAGNPTTYVWDDENRRTKLILPAGTINTSVYNGDGLRLRVTDSTFDWDVVWDGQMYLVLDNRLTAGKFVYTQRPEVYGDLISHRDVPNSQTLQYYFDGLGSTDRLTDGINIAGRYIYEAFGEVVLGLRIK